MSLITSTPDSAQRLIPVVARAEDGPAPTLVLDLRATTPPGADRAVLIDLADRARRSEMSRDSELGAKTMALLDVSGDVAQMMFVQGLPDGSVDTAIDVCINSAACALTVARHRWRLVPDGPLTVLMGGQSFGYQEVAE